MERFDKNGMMIIPHINPPQAEAGKRQLVVKECYCPNGHSLIDRHTGFNGHPGIMLEVKTKDKNCKIALSPIHGEKARICLDILLESGEELELHCPECHVALPVHSTCDCGSNIVAMFLTQDADFSDCIGICQRVDCHQAHVTAGGALLSKFQDELLG